MKEIDDIDLKKLLKEQSPQPQYDEWFTRKVMKRLPHRRPHLKWIQSVVYFLCGVICCLVWKEFLTDINWAAITVGEILKYITLTCVSFILLWQTLRATILSE